MGTSKLNLHVWNNLGKFEPFLNVWPKSTVCVGSGDEMLQGSFHYIIMRPERKEKKG